MGDETLLHPPRATDRRSSAQIDPVAWAPRWRLSRFGRDEKQRRGHAGERFALDRDGSPMCSQDASGTIFFGAPPSRRPATSGYMPCAGRGGPLPRRLQQLRPPGLAAGRGPVRRRTLRLGLPCQGHQHLQLLLSRCAPWRSPVLEGLNCMCWILYISMLPVSALSGTSRPGCNH